METTRLREVLTAAVLAGLIAGAVAAGFHWLFTESLIDRAIQFEESTRRSATYSSAEPVLSRPVQKFGLFAGFVVYGVAWGILFGLLVHAIRPRFAGTDFGKRGLLLALLLGWSVAIFPLLKYPANPPGVGDAETLGRRQELFLIFIGLSLSGTVMALIAAQRFQHKGWRVRALVLIAYVVYLVVIFAALPPNPDSVKLAPDLVFSFRALSLLGQVLFWAVMGALFWRLSTPRDRFSARRS